MARGKLFSKAGKHITRPRRGPLLPSNYSFLANNIDFLRQEGFSTINKCPVCFKYHKDFDKQMEKCILKLIKQKEKAQELKS